MLHKLIKKITSDNGAVTVEAAFIFPMIIAVIIILIYLAIFQIDNSLLHSYTQIIGQRVCNSICFPGYDLLGNEPASEHLDDIYAIHDPYRYVFGSAVNTDEYYEFMSSDVNSYTIFNGLAYNPQISVDRGILHTSVTVEVKYKIKMPKIVEFIGIGRNLYTTVSSVTYANDSIEFMRNFDLTSDIICNLMEKYKLGEKIQDIYQKLLGFRKTNK